MFRFFILFVVNVVLQNLMLLIIFINGILNGFVFSVNVVFWFVKMFGKLLILVVCILFINILIMFLFIENVIWVQVFSGIGMLVILLNYGLVFFSVELFYSMMLLFQLCGVRLIQLFVLVLLNNVGVKMVVCVVFSYMDIV